MLHPPVLVPAAGPVLSPAVPAGPAAGAQFVPGQGGFNITGAGQKFQLFVRDFDHIGQRQELQHRAAQSITVPVSYTHLDVYKRQGGVTRPRRNLAPLHVEKL